jgi:hypothetical protein
MRLKVESSAIGANTPQNEVGPKESTLESLVQCQIPEAREIVRNFAQNALSLKLVMSARLSRAAGRRVPL